uniref:hypothetical protein n=1 Tax=Acetatifactor sp. TaxID=1872090 RepID=UPI004055CC2B
MNTVLLEKKAATAESYCLPMQVTHLRKYRTTTYSSAPEAINTMKREVYGLL